MKSTLALAFTALAAAAPSVSTRETGDELVWTGDIQDGGPNRTCTSTLSFPHPLGSQDLEKKNVRLEKLTFGCPITPQQSPARSNPSTSKCWKQTQASCPTPYPRSKFPTPATCRNAWSVSPSLPSPIHPPHHLTHPTPTPHPQLTPPSLGRRLQHLRRHPRLRRRHRRPNQLPLPPGGQLRHHTLLHARLLLVR